MSNLYDRALRGKKKQQPILTISILELTAEVGASVRGITTFPLGSTPILKPMLVALNLVQSTEAVVEQECEVELLTLVLSQGRKMNFSEIGLLALCSEVFDLAVASRACKRGRPFFFCSVRILLFSVARRVTITWWSPSISVRCPSAGAAFAPVGAGGAVVG